MSLDHLDSLLACAVETARAAGKHALDHYNRRTEVVVRTAHDLKLQLDLECQEVAVNEILRWYPRHTWLGEEGGTPDPRADICWVVDPIDGTVNFSHGLPIWCCSVAALYRGQAVAGAVYLPMLQECFTATFQGPARCNNTTLRVSRETRLADSIVATSVCPPDADAGLSMGVFRELIPACQKVRMTGSAAAHLCYVAAGRLEGYVETLIRIWDCAAGGLLVARAGGRMQILEQLDPVHLRVMASNEHVHPDFHAAVRKGLGPTAATDAPIPTPWDRARQTPITP